MNDPLLIAAPLFLLLIGLEAASTRGRGLYCGADTMSSITIGLSNLASATLTKGITLALFVMLHQFALLDIPFEPSVVPLAIVADDLTVYWHHRAHHRLRLLWATHSVHHSSRYMNFGTALRHSCFAPITEPVFYAPMALAGFDPLMMLTCQSLSLIYGFFVHTECVRSLGPLELVMVTPSHHRVHHGIEPEYRDRNFGGIFILWDRLFGTFAAEARRPTYGLVDEIGTHNPLVITFHEWACLLRDVRRTRSWARRLGYVVRPPGWQPSAEPHAK
jgi:sterol desaturase/sphingolipid hydroxylase (fatty acid hydroxylase superfamily)